MSYESEQIRQTFVATTDLSSSQFYFVKLGTAGKVAAIAADTDVPIGVLQNTPVAGDEAIVCLAGVTKISSDAAVALGDAIGTSADGQALTYAVTDTTIRQVGKTLQASGAAGGYITATVDCLATGRFV